MKRTELRGLNRRSKLAVDRTGRALRTSKRPDGAGIIIKDGLWDVMRCRHDGGRDEVWLTFLFEIPCSIPCT